MKGLVLASALCIFPWNKTSMNQNDGVRKTFAISILKPDGNSGVEGLVKMVQEGQNTRI